MPKIGSPIKRPTSNGGFCGDQEAAPQLVINRERLNKSGPLAASVPVKFMELRPSMCRWPIGDPKHIETFRFCGSACSSGDIYCKAHTAKAHAPNRPRPPRTTKFQGCRCASEGVGSQSRAKDRHRRGLGANALSSSTVLRPDDDVEDCPPGQPVSKRLLLATTDRNGTTVFVAVDRVAHAFKHTETGHPNNPGVRRLAQP